MIPTNILSIYFGRMLAKSIMPVELYHKSRKILVAIFPNMKELLLKKSINILNMPVNLLIL